MRVLDRYVTRIFLTSTCAAFGFVVSLYVMVHSFTHLEDIEGAEKALATRGMNLAAGIFRYHLVTIPFILAKLGPFAILLAAMWTVQKMSRDQEITAAQVGGVSLHRLTLPILVAGAVMSLGLWSIRQGMLPRLAIENHDIERLVRGKTDPSMGPLLVRDGRGTRFSIQTYDPIQRTARIVEIRSFDLGQEVAVGAMRFDDALGRWTVIDDPLGPVPLAIETDLTPRDIEIDARGLRFIASGEVEELARRFPGRLDLQLMLHTRFTYPFSTMVLLLLGLPLVLRRDRQSIYAAWGLCLLLSILYFGAENVLYGLAERDGLLAPALAAWAPIIVFGIGGALTYQDL